MCFPICWNCLSSILNILKQRKYVSTFCAASATTAQNSMGTTQNTPKSHALSHVKAEEKQQPCTLASRSFKRGNNMQPDNINPQNRQRYQHFPPYGQETQPYQSSQPSIHQRSHPNGMGQARMPSYTGKAVVVVLLYFCGYLPGLICNIIFLIEALRTKKHYGRVPQGMGLLTILLLLSMTVIPLLAFISVMMNVLVGEGLFEGILFVFSFLHLFH